MIRQFELVEKVKSYDPNADEDALNRAYVFAMKAHGAQKRASGDPYFSHPLEVAGILCDMKLDTATIITALLHDTVEDTDATLEEIERLFGKEIAELVNGVTKLTRIELKSPKDQQAENFRKLVLAMSNDIRVLLVKLADRVHNMRTLGYVEEEKRKRIARETLDIYAPLAERIGVVRFKDELEDLAFDALNPDARDSILKRLEFLQKKDGTSVIDAVIQELVELLKKEGVKAEILGRIKRPYSIWRKMHHKNISIEQLLDIVAFRIVVDTLSDCYKVLGILHSNYSVIPARFKDYISTPKANGYQSLHTGVVGPHNERIELQIRTREMHEVAEFGVAAHWQYKQGSKEHHDFRWLRSLLEILENASGAEEFLEHTKLEMFQDQVFCFTPAGDLITLPQGATPIDFGYAIHSQVGNHCVAAKVNGRMVPLRTVLVNGDQVEITTSKQQHPSPSWERFVVTGKARANIRRFIRSQKHDQFASLGKSMVHKGFEQAKLDHTEKQIDNILPHFKVEHADDLYALVGEGLHTVHEVIKQIYPNYQTPKKEKISKLLEAEPQPIWKDKESALSIRGLIPGMAVHYAGCCHPLPEDRIVGIIMSGRGVTIHTYDCEELKNFANEPERWIDVSWADQKGDETHVGRLYVVLDNRPGALANLTTTISRNHGNIVNLKVANRSENFFEVTIDIEVKGAKHLTDIIASLRASPLINSVDRI
jgi:guanosine-3',5'-bis(diphosphate) 3'-pyrophosphohydrolase